MFPLPIPGPLSGVATTRRVIAAGSLAVAAASVQAAPLNAELIINGDAETGDATGWTSTGIEAVSSAVSGTLGLPPGVGIGDWSFTGALGDINSQALAQTVDLSVLAGPIDQASLNYSFGALVQSRREGTAVDTGRITMSFVDGSGFLLLQRQFEDSQVISGLHDWTVVQDSGLVPVGARRVELLLDSWRSAGASTDAFFDNLSLQVSAVNLARRGWARWGWRRCGCVGARAAWRGR